MAGALGKLEAKDSGKFPSQTELNPKQNVSAMTLRSGKNLESRDENTVLIDDEEEEIVVEDS